MARSTEDELRDAGLPHAARAYAHAWTVGGILCLAWGLAIPALFFWRRWSVAGAFGLSAVLVTGTALLVLAGFVRRRRAWAAHGIWAITLAILLSLVAFTFAWGRVPGPVGLILLAIAAVNVALTGWHACCAVRELERVTHGGERGFDALPSRGAVTFTALPVAPAAPETPPAGQPAPSESSREK